MTPFTFGYVAERRHRDMTRAGRDIGPSKVYSTCHGIRHVPRAIIHSHPTYSDCDSSDVEQRIPKRINSCELLSITKLQQHTVCNRGTATVEQIPTSQIHRGNHIDCKYRTDILLTFCIVIHKGIKNRLKFEECLLLFCSKPLSSYLPLKNISIKIYEGAGVSQSV
jgi:hypothetical protein